MTLFDYYLCYMTEVWEGTRPAPEGITLPEGGDENARMQALGQQLQDMGMAAFGPRLRRPGRHGIVGGAVHRKRRPWRF